MTLAPARRIATAIRSPGTLRAMGFMAVAALSGTVMNACIRYASLDVHAFEVAFFRAFFGFCVLAPVFLRRGSHPLRTGWFRLHATRGTINGVAQLMFFFGLGLTPLAKVAALNFSSPLFATILAIIVLGEVIRARRIMALIIGFAGALVILRPGMVALDVGALLILGSSSIVSVTMIMAKILVRTESSLTITLYTALFAVPITFAAMLPFWQTPTLLQLAWFVVIGALGSLNHLCLAQALKEAEITAILPIAFTRLIWASIIGYVVFAEVPDIWIWVGGVMIFSAVTYIAFRERAVKKAPPAPGAGSSPV